MAIQAKMYSGFSLGGPQDLLVMENACGLNINNLSYIPHQKQQQEQELMQRIPFLPKNSFYDQQSMAFSQIVSAHLENQKNEIDFFINSENERLRMVLQEKGKQQISLLLKKYESKIQFLMTQKEEEIAKAANRNMELQDYLKRLEMENQTWQRVAIQNEAMVASLNSTFERLRETAANAAADDAESCCVEEDEKTEKCEEKTWNVICRCCNSRKSCFVMMPCRHLCSCRDCEAFLDSCPVCNMVKKASIEALV